MARPLDRECLTQGSRPDWFLERVLRHHVDTTAQQLLESNLESSQVEKRPPRLQGNQEIHVACIVILAAGNGAEDTNVARAMRLGRRLDFGP